MSDYNWFEAVKDGDIDRIKKLIDDGQYVNHVYFHGSTALSRNE